MKEVSNVNRFLRDMDWQALVEHKEAIDRAIQTLAMKAWKEENIKFETFAEATEDTKHLYAILELITALQTTAMQDGWPVKWNPLENPFCIWDDELGDLKDERTGKVYDGRDGF